MDGFVWDKARFSGIFGRKASLTRIFFHDRGRESSMATRDEESGVAQSSRARHLDIAALLFLLALAAAVRLPGIGRPLLGNFATKQAVYGMIARNWAEGRAPLWYPTLDVLRGGDRSLHLVELPISTYLTGAAWRGLGGSLDVWGRATAVLFSLGSVALLFLLVRRRHGLAAAVGAGLAMALSPVSVIYGQSFMLEASLVFFTVAAFYALDRWLELPATGSRRGRPVWLVVAGLAVALLLLTKIYMAVVLLPLGLMVFRAGGRSGRMARWAAGAVLVLAVVPAAAWYGLAWHASSPEGPLAERVFYSVRDSAESHRPPHPLLFSLDFYRGLLDDVTGVVLTPLGFALALAGLLDRQWRRWAAWLAVSLLLVLALPRKFHEMNYYWMAVLPPLCILVGLGWQVVYERLRQGRLAVAVVLLAALLLSLRYAVKPAFFTPAEDRAVVAAGRAVQQYAAEKEPVVALHGTSLDLLYYCDRPGWTVSPPAPHLGRQLDDGQQQRARYAVVVGAQASGLGEMVAEGDGYTVYRVP
jgi:4-amino-4-deoxy-L-arabinose transferase-like glycosyltransferase